MKTERNDPSHLRHLYLEWVDTHPHIPDFAKELAKDVVSKSFLTLGASLGAIELSCHRQWYADGKPNTEVSHSHDENMKGTR